MGLSPWVRKIPWRRKWQPAPVFSPGKFHGQRKLVDYSLWGHKELDTTEHTHIKKLVLVYFYIVNISILVKRFIFGSFSGGSVVKNPPANTGDPGSIPGSGRPLGERNGNPLQYSCLGNPMDKEPGGLQSMGLQRVGHNLVTKQQLYLFTKFLSAFPP